MAFAAPSIRHFINLMEALLFEAQEWAVARTDLFDASLAEHMAVFPDLNEKLIKFLDVKSHNPLASRYGKHDGPMTALLKGFFHCHLRDDAVLIYKLERHTIVLVAIVKHSEIEGKRLKKTAARLAPFNPRA
jgi:mRNA-degrading endonuclease YafQ of YafQ-DinJ toxin-antitoxin module